MRPLLVVVLLASLAGCVSRGPATPADPPATTTTTRAEPTNPVAGSEVVSSGMRTVRTWLTGCAPSVDDPGCDRATADALISPVLAVVDDAVERSPHPHAYENMCLADASTAVRDAVSGIHSGSDWWHDLVVAWAGLEAAVAA